MLAGQVCGPDCETPEPKSKLSGSDNAHVIQTFMIITVYWIKCG